MFADHYLLIKTAHVTLVTLSASLFLARGLAVLALKRARSERGRRLAFLLALACLAAMAAMAHWHHPLGPFAAAALPL